MDFLGCDLNYSASNGYQNKNPYNGPVDSGTDYINPCGPEGMPQQPPPVLANPALHASSTTAHCLIDFQKFARNSWAASEVPGPASNYASFSEHFVNKTDFYPGPQIQPVVSPCEIPIDTLPRPGPTHIDFYTGPVSPCLTELFSPPIHHGFVPISMMGGSPGPKNLQCSGQILHSTETSPGYSQPPLPQNPFGPTYPPGRYAREFYHDEQAYSQNANMSSKFTQLPVHAAPPSSTGFEYFWPEMLTDNPRIPNDSICQSAAALFPNLDSEVGCAYVGRDRPICADKGPASPSRSSMAISSNIPTRQCPPATAQEKVTGPDEEGFYDTIVVCPAGREAKGKRRKDEAKRGYQTVAVAVKMLAGSRPTGQGPPAATQNEMSGPDEEGFYDTIVVCPAGVGAKGKRRKDEAQRGYQTVAVAYSRPTGQGPPAATDEEMSGPDEEGFYDTVVVCPGGGEVKGKRQNDGAQGGQSDRGSGR
ncbi:hypothetical protein EV426DRAFT_707472 [Tirmania nivea]|nr:hypothetical protein EV426DRAFT_707472 [Tirmania nivea]